MNTIPCSSMLQILLLERTIWIKKNQAHVMYCWVSKHKGLNTRMEGVEAWLAHLPSLHMLDMPRLAVSATDPLSVCILEASHVPDKAPALCLLNCRGAPEVNPRAFPLMPPVCMFDSHSKREDPVTEA